MPQLDAGKDVILAVHSYGGLPGAVAAKGLSKEERMADGKEGGIVGLLFICALVARTGDSLLSILPGRVFDPWVIQYDNGQLGVRDPKQVFYADVPSPQDRAAIDALRNQSRASLSTPGGPPAWPDAVYDDRRSYFRTLDDQSIPAVAQKAFLDGSGVQWIIPPPPPIVLDPPPRYLRRITNPTFRISPMPLPHNLFKLLAIKLPNGMFFIRIAFEIREPPFHVVTQRHHQPIRSIGGAHTQPRAAGVHDLELPVRMSIGGLVFHGTQK
ncbi:MAG: hypothetical protein Q9183_004640 [Haloplaca sp. 2 TL-2023]